MTQFFSAFYLVSSINGTLLILILLFTIRKERMENLFLSLILLIVSAYLFKNYLILNGYFSKIPHTMAALVPFFYLLGPLYYFYLRFAANIQSSLTLKDALHAVPAIICLITLLPFYLKSAAEKLAIYRPPDMNMTLAFSRGTYYILMLLLASIYAVISYRILAQKESVPDKRSTRSKKNKIQWLRFYTKSFLAFLIIFFIAQLLFIFTDLYLYHVMLFTVLASSVFIHVIAFWAIRSSFVTSDTNKQISISPVQAQAIVGQLINLLEDEKLYLEQNLSLGSLSEKLQTNSQYLSQLINEHFRCNFSQLINSYRIEAAKRILKQGKHDHLNLLGIAMEVGFQTKNTFTRAFKNHTGVTPSEYMKSINQSS